jgi:hypothetical protein
MDADIDVVAGADLAYRRQNLRVADAVRCCVSS